MGKKFYLLSLLLLILLQFSAHAQLAILTPNDTGVCGTATLRASGNGMVPITLSLPADDDYAANTTPIGFSFTFYGNTYTRCLISSNGYITFNLSDSGAYSAWPLSTTTTIPSNTACQNSICGVYEDIYLVSSGTIEYATVGTAPNRKFVVTFCNCPLFSCTTQTVTFQIMLYETSNNIEVHITHKDVCSAWNSGLAIEGIESANGTYGTPVSGRNCTVWNATNDAYQFVPNGTTSYTVSSIPFAPVPDSSAPIYWYQGTTYLNSGPTTTVSPTAPTIYTAKVVNCGNDTSSASIQVLIGTGITATAVLNQPTLCGSSNGAIVLSGLTPGSTDTIHYKRNGVQQSYVVTTANNAGVIVLGNLPSGTYDSIWIKSTSICPSNVMGPYNLIYPPINVKSVTQPSTCGACDGKIVIHGLQAFVADTINYTFNGAAQPQIILTAGGDSSISLVNLCAGTYANIEIKAGSCVSNVLGPVNLVNPPITSNYTYAIKWGCNGDTVIFTNHSTSPGATVLDSKWVFNDGTVDTNANPVHIFQHQGIYNVELYVTNGMCVDSSNQSINLVHPIKASFTVSKDTICQGQQVIFTNTSVGNATPTPPTYYWDFNDGNSSTVTSPAHIFDNYGTYHIKLVETDFVPCKDSAYHTITVDSISFNYFTTSDSVICLGKEILFTGYNVNIGRVSTLWNFGDSTIIYNRNPITYGYSSPGIYHVTYTANYRVCPDTTYKKDLTVLPYPVVNVGPDTSLCPGNPGITVSELANINNPNVTYLWNTGATTSSINVNTPGWYYTTVTEGGCTATDSMFVRNDCYLDIPNVFTPNGDGTNDYFLPRQFLSSGLTSFKMEIFNRWGELLFQTNNVDGRGWDGAFNGKPQPEGVYIYMIKAGFKNGATEQRNGNVTLIR